jgi:hypothetical protein
MKTYGGVEVQIHIFLTSALVGGEWSDSRPCRFTPGERTPGTHWIGGWVGPIAGLDYVEKRKLLTLPGLELRPLGRPARRQSLYRLHVPDLCVCVYIIKTYTFHIYAYMHMQILERRHLSPMNYVRVRFHLEILSDSSLTPRS